MSGEAKRGPSILFVGFMGSGKSTVARKVAETFSWRLVDLDRLIERRARMTIPAIFEAEGEQGFRHRETDALASLSSQGPCIVACGGGIVTVPGNIPLMRELGSVVYLRVTVDEVRRRIRDTSSRPLLGGSVPPERILETRLPLYEAAADLTVDTVGKTVDEVAMEVGELLWKKGLI